MSAFSNPNASYITSSVVQPSVFVTISGSFAVAASGSGDLPIGVSAPGSFIFNQTYAAPSGGTLGVFSEGQQCWLLYGGTVTAGDRLKPDSSGRGVTASGTDSSGAVALESGAVNELHLVRVEIVPVVSS